MSDCYRCEGDTYRELRDSKGNAVKCSFPGCSEPAAAIVNGKPYCAFHAAVAQARVL